MIDKDMLREELAKKLKNISITVSMDGDGEESENEESDLAPALPQKDPMNAEVEKPEAPIEEQMTSDMSPFEKDGLMKSEPKSLGMKAKKMALEKIK